MFDTMTATKIVGGLCGSLLVFLLGNWAATSIYGLGEEGHGEEHAMAYEIVVEGAEDQGAEAAAETEEVDFAALVAAADADKGKKVFGKCKACHKVDGSNSTGPHLDGVVGRDIGSVADFNYSDVLSTMPGAWTPEALSAFLENPRGYAEGTKMGFSGLSKVADRADVIAYLSTLGG